MNATPSEMVPMRRRAAWKVPLALAVLVLVTLGPVVHALTVQPGSRLALTAAIVDGHTLRIDDYRDTTRAGDRVDADDGHLYTDKAPGQPLVAVPAYALARLVGAEPATIKRVDGNLTLWWVTFWSSVVPAAVLAVLMYVMVARDDPGAAVPVALALIFGSPLVVWSVELYGHLLAAAFAYGSWVLLSRATRRPGAIVAAGFLIGMAVITELPVAIIGAVLTVVLLVRRDVAGVGWYALGAVPAAAVMAGYNTLAFGAPLMSAYSLHVGDGGAGQTDLATGAPRLDVIAELLGGGRGFILTPVVLVALGAAVWVLVARRPHRTDAAVALGAFGGLLLFAATRKTGWPGPLGGEMPAPRHLLPALPFLAVPLAAAWDRARALVIATATFGAMVMAAPTLVSHLIPIDAPYLDWYRSLLDSQGLAPTVFTHALGGAGWVVHLALVAVAAAWLVHELRRARSSEPSRRVDGDQRAASSR